MQFVTLNEGCLVQLRAYFRYLSSCSNSLQHGDLFLEVMHATFDITSFCFASRLYVSGSGQIAQNHLLYCPSLI